MVDRQVIAAVSRALRLSITVQTREAGFHVEQSSGDVHQGAIIDRFCLCAELLCQFDLLCNDFSWNSQAQYRECVTHLHQAGQKIFKFAVLSHF